MSSFQQFLESKRHSSQSFGIEPIWLPDKMFDYQKHVAEVTIRKGRWAEAWALITSVLKLTRNITQPQRTE